MGKFNYKALMKKSAHHVGGSAPASDVKGKKKKTVEASDPSTRLPKRARADVRPEIARSVSPLSMVEETPVVERIPEKAPMVTDLTLDTKWYNGRCNPSLGSL